MVEGEAEGLAQAVQLRPVVGLHEYVVPPVALRMVGAPMQIATSGPALTTGNELTVTVTVVLAVQPMPLVPVTVYVAVVPGVTVGLAQAVQERSVDGDHE